MSRTEKIFTGAFLLLPIAATIFMVYMFLPFSLFGEGDDCNANAWTDTGQIMSVLDTTRGAVLQELLTHYPDGTPFYFPDNETVSWNFQTQNGDLAKQIAEKCKNILSDKDWNPLPSYSEESDSFHYRKGKYFGVIFQSQDTNQHLILLSMSPGEEVPKEQTFPR